MQRNREKAYLVLVVKKPGLINDIQARIFSVTSYLLISHPHVVFSMADYARGGNLQYYPELKISLGEPRGDFAARADSIFVREFEHGLVLINPASSGTQTVSLPKEYYKIIPTGGGLVDTLGHYEGKLTYQKVSGNVDIPAVSALILKDSLETSVHSENQTIHNFSLTQNYPNPFNASTLIEYTLTQASFVRLTIYNELGEIVCTVQQGRQLAGTYPVLWDGKNAKGHPVPSGLYFYQLQAENRFSKIHKMIYLK